MSSESYIIDGCRSPIGLKNGKMIFGAHLYGKGEFLGDIYFGEFDNQEKNGELICLLGDFNIAPSNKDIHAPQRYAGGIMASEIERNALNNVLKERLIDSFRVYEKNTGHWSWWDS